MNIFAKTFFLLSFGLAFSSQASDSRYIIQVDNANKGLIKALTKQLNGTVNLDGDGFIAATFPQQDLDSVRGLLNNPHIKLIETDQRRVPLNLYNDDVGDPTQIQITPYAVYQSQANQMTFESSAGIKVCIIDSGLDQTNQDFDWNNITGDNDSGTGDWNTQGGPHGTHVAGTIGAADNDFGVIGMAPGVDMHIIKVFNQSGWGYSSDLAHAASKCSEAGANIISMSLGGGGANNTEENAFNHFTDAGGLVVAAAGNDGDAGRTYPAGYSSVMMVGANDSNNTIATFSQYPSCTIMTGRGKRRQEVTDDQICVEITAGGVDTLSTYPAGLATSANLSADGQSYLASAMENSGQTSGAVYAMGTAETLDTNANGKVCVIDRGNISFHDKVQNCENSGGIAAVIINNEPGVLYGTLGQTNQTTIPAIGSALEDRGALISAVHMSISIGNSDYGLMSGTSMATPAISGLAALLWSNHSDCSGTEIRNALKSTAQDAGLSGHDVNFGYGIAKVADADVYLTSNGCNSVEPPPPPGELTLSVTASYSKGKYRAALSWSGANTSSVDIIRNGQLKSTTNNDGTYVDVIKRVSGNYTYSVCEAGTSTCSADIEVTF